ncbi:MAG: NAD(P)H-dependent oxidoreductase [Erysipelothrix sp.]|nr:NAD(P)H-dependent oxidoreductase [Erysipelothrix sp.]
MDKQYKFAAIAGSLGVNSLSKKMIKEIEKSLDGKAVVTELLYDQVPVFNQDIEFPTPEAVATFRTQLKEYDGIIIVSPEYNLSIPGTLKNLIDWISRAEVANDPKPTLDYPVLIYSFSAGISGGMVPQEQLRSLLGYLGANVKPQPRASFGNIFTQIDENFNLNLNEASQSFLSSTALAFVDYVSLFK